MSVALYMDVHVPGPVTGQLRRRGVDVLTAQEDGWDTASDEALLMRAAELGRVIFTQDVLFRVLAQDWQRNQRPFTGLLFGPQLGGTVGEYVKDLEIIALASETEDWVNKVEFLPFRP
jgi:hypothetical protein